MLKEKATNLRGFFLAKTLIFLYDTRASSSDLDMEQVAQTTIILKYIWLKN